MRVSFWLSCLATVFVAIASHSPRFSSIAAAQGIIPASDPADGNVATRPEIVSPSIDGDGLGRFELAVPPGYTVVNTPTGISFTSPDGQFGGMVDRGSAQGQQLSLLDLEAALKHEYEQRLAQVTWQGSYVHRQGGVRIDWLGYDTFGNQLDAISFIEQRGNTIFVLSLWAINAAYSAYNDDADAIFATYRIQADQAAD
jgi:hypothetical protein